MGRVAEEVCFQVCVEKPVGEGDVCFRTRGVSKQVEGYEGGRKCCSTGGFWAGSVAERAVEDFFGKRERRRESVTRLDDRGERGG